MSRTIKFRAWDKKLEKWVDGSKEGFNLFGECTLIGRILEDHYYTHNVFENLYNDVEVVQYTGLKDKNGKEVYEGDVLEYVGYKCPACWRDIDIIANLYYEIKWNNEYAGFEGYDNKTKDTICSDEWVTSMKIIGNIYENPELLK